MNQEQRRADLARFVEAGIRRIAGESAMQSLGKELARCLPKGTLVTLSGELGAGKSVLVRSIIHALGYTGRVKSPTYTLIETYELAHPSDGRIQRIAHLDLYRLQDPAELDYLGFEDVIDENDLVLIEWPQLGGDRVPTADLHMIISYADEDQRHVACQSSLKG